MRRWLTRVAAALAVLLLAAAIVLGVVAYSPPPAFDSQQARAVAGAYKARIIRDRFGAPHLYGARDADVAFGLGYAHAEDDWKTLESVVLLARGRTALRDGAAAAPGDYLFHLFGVGEAVADGYRKTLSPDVRAVVEAYAAGITLYAADHPGKISPWALPVTGEDVVAGFAFRAPFFFGLEPVLKSLLAEDGKQAALPDAMRQAFHLKDGAEFGSNAIAVAPSRSEDGHTRLLINSHQPYSGPVAWYEARLKSEEGWDMVGGLFPGSPVVLVGHNRSLGWAHTVNEPDLIDVYRLEVDDADDPRRYRHNGAWRDFERRLAPLRIKLFGPFAVTVTRPVLRSVHGPALVTGKGAFAIAFAGQGELRAVEQWYRMNRAENLEDWRAAMAMNAVPSLNTIYADKTGAIGFVYNALIPDRTPGHDYQGILDGADPALVWRGALGFDAVPQLYNPRSGYLVSANGTPLRVTDPADDLKPDAIPETMRVEWHQTNRVMRALALFGGDDSISEADFLRYKFDKAYAPDSNFFRFVNAILAMDFSDDPDLMEAQALLGEWDGAAEQDNEIAPLAILGTMKAIRGFAFKGWDMEPGEALRETVAELKKYHGGLRVRWGDINLMRRGGQALSLGGGPDTLRAVYGGRALRADGTLDAVAGDTYYQIVDWAADGALRTRSIHQFGSATLDEGSAHFADQMPLFAAEKLREMPLDEAALLRETSRDYSIGGGPD